MGAAAPDSPQAAIKTMRVIGVAIASGVTAAALVAWSVQRGGPPPPTATPALFYVWIAVATSLLAASMILWRGNVVPLIQRPALGSAWRKRARKIQTGVVVSWLVVGGGAIFGVILCFAWGIWQAGALGAAMMWITLAITWPRDEWLAAGSGAE